MQKFLFLILSFCFIPVSAMEQPPVISMNDEKTLTFEKSDIFTACAKGDLKRVSEFIKSGVSVDRVCPYELERFKNSWNHGMKGCTPLMIAAAAGHSAIISLLIKAGANIYRRYEHNIGSFDAFCFAVIFNHIHTGQALLHAGVQIDTVVHRSFIQKMFGQGTRIFDIIITLDRLAACSFMVASGARVRAISLALAVDRSEDLLRGIISRFLVVPTFDRYQQSALKVKMLLMFFKRMALPRDLRHSLILRAVPKDMITLLARYHSLNKRIPSYGLDLMTNACYNTTAEQLVPELERVHQKYANHERISLLDPTNFDQNYGQELRANIRARLANPYQYMNQILALEDKKEGGRKK